MTGPDSEDTIIRNSYALLRSGRPDEALARLREAAQSGSSIALQLATANVLLATGRIDESIECVKEALAACPELPAVRSNLANLLHRNGRFAEAIAQYEVLIEADSEDADARYRLGIVLQDLGEKEKALAAFRDAVSVDPAFVRAWYGIAVAPGQNLSEEEVGALEAMRAAAGTSQDERVRLGFALGRHFEKAGQHERAAKALLEANALRRADLDYDVRNNLQAMRNLAKCFDSDFFSKWSEAGVDDGKPIFIVGMPRSGTTLVEQVLASHSRVHGAGELPFLTAAIVETFPVTNGLDYTDSLADAAARDFRTVARRYLDRLPGADADRVTDKLPHNFLNVGMIRVLFPQAAIIHCRREPRDTCFSIFKQLFGSDAHAYAYDLEDLAQFYNGYAALMDHWEQVMPGHIHTVEYEALVRDQENVSRQLVEACGLDWEPACLEFHRLERPIATLSAAQVRQPVHSGAIGSWKHYADMLAPLLEQLAEQPPAGLTGR